MKKLIFTLALSVISSLSIAQKAFDEFVVTKNFESFTSFTAKALPTANTTATVNINNRTVVNPINQALFGQNSAAFQGNTVVTGNREQNWKNAKFSFVRYPGGNWSNRFFWNGETPTTIKVENEMNGDVSQLFKGNTGWMLGTSEFPDLLNLMGSKGIVCVNVGYAFYGTSANPVETAAQYAADWVKYYNIDLNAGIKYWELGNENYGPWQAGFSLGSPQKYAEACLVFAQKMKAIDPTIKIGVVLYEGDGGFNQPQGKDWNEIVLPIVQDIMDYAIIHHYPHPNNNKNAISEKNIYDAVSVVGETVATMQRQTTTYTNKPAGYYPIAITEYNARTGVREISRTNALFTTMMLGEYSKYKDYAATMQWDLENGYDAVTRGTHGSVAKDDPFMINGDPYPSLLAHYYMRKYFGDKLIASNSTDTDIVVYPTTFTSGEIGIVMINKGATDKNVLINGGNSFAQDDRIYWHTINGDLSDFDRTLYINDQGPSSTFTVGQTYTNATKSAIATQFEANGVGGPTNYTAINPYSAVLNTNNSFNFNAKAYSANYLVLVPKNLNAGMSSYFEQSFDETTLLGNYFNTTPLTNQFDVITTGNVGASTSGSSITGATNQLTFTRNASAGLIAARTTDLAVPASRVYQMKFDFTGNQNASLLIGTPAAVGSNQVHVALGNNFDTSINIPAAATSLLQLRFNISNTIDNTFGIAILNSSGTVSATSPPTPSNFSATFTGSKTIRYIINSKNNNITYTNHLGITQTLASNKFDLYVDDVLAFDDKDLTAPGITPTDFKISNTFSSNISGRGLATFDNILYNAATGVTDIIVTPVVLTTFKAKAENNAIQLQWSTASEKNSSHFEILRSADGKVFSKIGKTQSAGNTNAKNDYSFIDNEPSAGNNYYQLKQVDYDGTITFSNVIVVSSNLQSAKLNSYATSSGLNVNVYLDKASVAKIYLYNTNGQKLAEKDVFLTQGYNKEIEISIDLQPGLYIVNLTLKSQILKSKFIKK